MEFTMIRVIEAYMAWTNNILKNNVIFTIVFYSINHWVKYIILVIRIMSE